MPELAGGTLDERTAAELQHHIGQCPACRCCLRALQGDDKLLSDFAKTKQSTIARLEHRVICALGEKAVKEATGSISVWRAAMKSPVVRFAIAACLIFFFLLLSLLYLTEGRNREMETSPRYILGEAQNNQLKEVRPCDILPPLPE
jgi:hypothetical protein